MDLVDPVSRSQFTTSLLAKLPWVGKALARLAITQARAAARRLDWQNAVAQYGRALRLDPGNGSAWVQLGHGFGKLDFPVSAQIAYRNATRAQPRLALGHRHLGTVLFDTDRRDEAIRSLANALFLSPHDNETRGFLKQYHDDIAIEREIANAGITLSESHATARYIGVRASLLRKQARDAARRHLWERAEGLYRQLALMRPDNPQAQLQLGNMLTQQHKHGEAELAYRRATAAAPLFADAWLHLGYSLVAQEERGKARESFAIFSRLAPERSRDHPVILAISETEVVEAEAEAEPEAVQRLVVPKNLGNRELAIWLGLAARIEGGA